MTQLQFLADAGDDAVFAAFAGSLAFLAVYILLARGYRSPLGRALIRLDTGLVLTLGPSVIHRLFGLSLASIGYSWYFVASIALVACATWERAWFVVKAQAKGAGLTPGQFGRDLLAGIWHAPGRMLRRKDAEVHAAPEEVSDGPA
jgi:hypothetical protein